MSSLPIRINALRRVDSTFPFQKLRRGGRNNWITHIPLLAGLLLASFPAFAQDAQFQGRVSDPQDAGVGGADVLITNQATGVERKLRTNGSGLYSAPFISPGTYKISVQAPRFNAEASEPLTITVGQNLEFNVQLQIGPLRQEVTVEAGSRTLNITDGSVSTVVDRQFIENTPLNGRSFQDLISLTPGVVGSGNFSVNGQRTESNNYIVDGVSANVSPGYNTGTPSAGTGGNLPAQTALGTTQSLLSVDALQEFRVSSSSYSAEFGRDPGGQFSFTSRSGTNSYHGSGFDYVRNNFFDANDWFNNY